MQRGQIIERLHTISCDRSLSVGDRSYAAGACEAISDSAAEPPACLTEGQTDPESFMRGWRDAKREGVDVLLNLTMAPPAALAVGGRAFR